MPDSRGGRIWPIATDGILTAGRLHFAANQWIRRRLITSEPHDAHCHHPKGSEGSKRPAACSRRVCFDAAVPGQPPPLSAVLARPLTWIS